MAVMVPLKVDLNAKPEEVIWRRTFIPTGQVGEFAETGLSRWVNFDGTPGSFNVGKEFTDAELDVIRKTPFLAARIEASSQVPTPIGYRDSYKNRASRLDARQIYNYATKNPLEFLKSELPAYLGAGDPEAATLLIQEIKNAGEPVENLQKLYEDALEKAPQYTETSSQYAARQYVENRGSSDPIGSFLKKYIIPIATTAGAIAGGPVGAAVANSIAQLSETGKVDPAQVAISAATASLAQPGTSTAVGETIGLTGQAADVAGGALLGAGISTAAGGDPIKGAVAGAIGSVGSTTYATDVGNALGVTGTAAPIVGNAVINSALSGIAAAATGGNVEKSMLTGAISGAATASAKEVAEAILGKDNIASIADTTGLSKSQVENVFTTSIANGVIAEVQGTGEFLETVGTSLAAQGVGAKSANLMTEATAKALEDSPAIRASVITATGGIATVATNAAIQGEDVGKALENAAPGIILSSVQAGQREADRQEELAAQREKELVAAQQPTEVAGPVTEDVLSQIKSQPLVGEELVDSQFTETDEGGLQLSRIQGVRNDGTPYEYGIFTYENGDVQYVYYNDAGENVYSDIRPELKNSPQTIGVPSEVIAARMPVIAGIDLREEVGASGVGRAFLGGGGAGNMPITWQLIGRDPATNTSRVNVAGEGFTLIVLPNNEKVLLSDIRDVILVPTKDPNTNELVFNQAPATDVIPEEQLRPVQLKPGEAAPEEEGVTGEAGTPGGLTAEQIQRRAEERDRLVSKIVQDEIERLERELQQAEAQRQQTAQNLQRAQQQQQRFSEPQFAGMLGPDITELLEAEIATLEGAASEAERAREAAAAEREGIGAVQRGEQRLSDEQLYAYMKTGDLPPLTGGEGDTAAGTTGPGTGGATDKGAGPGAGETGTGPGAGEEGAGIGGGGEGGVGGGLVETRLRPTVIFDRTGGGRTETTPFASRVTGEALASILGEKQPLFGGDEDEQQAVWNRRSLRLLSRALGL